MNVKLFDKLYALHRDILTMNLNSSVDCNAPSKNPHLLTVFQRVSSIDNNTDYYYMD